jgi:hypothetical protein
MRPLRQHRACSCEAAKGFAPSGKTGSKVSLRQLLYLSVCEAHVTRHRLIRVSGHWACQSTAYFVAEK